MDSDDDEELTPTPTWHGASRLDARGAFDSASRRRRVAEAARDDLEEVTPVVDMLERELHEPELAVVRRSRRNGDDPATYSDVVKLAREMAGDRRWLECRAP